MKAIRAHQFGPPSVLQLDDVPDPRPGAGQVLVQIKAAGVNCPTQKGFINNLRLVKNYTADGFFDPIDFQYVFNKPFQCVYYVQIVNKAFVPAFGGQKVCGDLIKNNKLIAGTTVTTVAGAATTTTAAR